MKARTLIFILAATFTHSINAAPPDRAPVDNPKSFLKTNFWGKLYEKGGTSFYCKKEFKKKSILYDESYIYSDSWIRDHLRCGTPRQCRKNSPDYRLMVTDMHNIFPAVSKIELNRRDAKFEELGDEIAIEECGIKRSFLIMEPADDIKGDIARAIFYMSKTYDLPLVGFTSQLKRWHQSDPASREEVLRNTRVMELQGNENPFITNSRLADQF
ncbi:endonuclease I [Oleiphilus messinensis]|uniref:Endonuclease I n=1 Tax=Oleiphilus messinensis TaxID=141451 RepID=A0A1Y0I685_9GAMM|nr:endonuclease [Oleiphilus messinensis]ARU55931.1 endonuclease I [Oleiphilus messinensis]